jgi:hypothetical protein
MPGASNFIRARPTCLDVVEIRVTQRRPNAYFATGSSFVLGVALRLQSQNLEIITLKDSAGNEPAPHKAYPAALAPRLARAGPSSYKSAPPEGGLVLP